MISRRIAAGLTCLLTLPAACDGGGSVLDQRQVVHRHDAVKVDPAPTDTRAAPDADAASDTVTASDTVPDSDHGTVDTTRPVDSHAGTTDTAPPCPLGHACNPIPMPSFPFTDSRDTAASTSSVVGTS